MLLLLSGLIISLTGCGGQGPSVSISATPEVINFDESTILTWSTHDADSVSINNGVGTVANRGTIEVNPYRTTTYTISAVNADGHAESSVTVKVLYSGPKPVINVSANPTTIFPEEESVLIWSTTNANTLSIDNKIGSVPLNYSMTVSPMVTTTYTFVAFGPGGETTVRVSINVTPNAPTAKITANPTSIKLGDVSVLEWIFTNANTVTIEPDIGDGTLMRSKEVSPVTNTTYTIKVSGPGGTATDNVTIFVDDPDPDRIFVDIQANPTSIRFGDTSVLSWTTRHATRVWIEPDIGEVDLSGTYTVEPKVTTTYKIHVEKNGYETFDSVTVNVVHDIPNVSITAEPSRINLNETATLLWETQNAETVEIDQGIGFVSSSGSKTITPIETTTYTIKATSSAGFNSASVTVYVEEDVPLGNQQFLNEHAKQIDPLAPYRLNFDLSKDTDRILQEKIDWTHHIPDVKHQKQTGSDSAWAMVYYLRSFQESVSKQLPVDQTMFSPMYTHVLQCRNETDPWSLIKTWKIAHRYGCATWTSLPFEDLDGFMDEIEINAYASYQFSDSLFFDALDDRMGSPVMLTDLDQIRMMLTQMPIVLAINHFDPAMHELSQDQNFITYSDQTDVAHTVLCIGYDNKLFGTGALKIVNSWGKEWAQDGMSWIKYTDLNKIVVSALAFHSLPERIKNKTEGSEKLQKPENVQASSDKGPYVDIQWTHVTNAQYYQIYRAPAASQSDVHEIHEYEWIGTAMHSPYRDFPAASNEYLYAVVAVNEFGSSEHLNHQDEKESHIAIGLACGKSLSTPALTYETKPAEGQSEFRISSIDPDTERFQVFVSHSKYGPWQSFGWIKPSERFVIDWYRDKTWVGYQPNVRVVAENQSKGFSMASRAVQVPSFIAPQNQIATINNLNAQVTDVQTIELSWSFSGNHVEFLDIWRTFDIQSSSSTWTKLDTISAELDTYHDTKAVAGINYQYAVHCIYEGISGVGQKSQFVQLPLNQANLKIVHVESETGPLTMMEDFEMELIIENNGNLTIQDYHFKVMAYNWTTNSPTICLEDNVRNYQDLKHPMTPGSKHIFAITFNLPEPLNSGELFSWQIMVDSKQAIGEIYESDNIYWAQKMCWMEMEQ
jgi:hypothetical protein